MIHAERALELLSEEHICPHCNQKMDLIEAPAFGFADGLGWGDFLFLCMNDDCNYFTESWVEFSRKNYSKQAGARFGLVPGGEQCPVLVYSPEAYTQLIINEKQLRKEQSESELRAAFKHFDEALSALHKLHTFLLSIKCDKMAVYIKTILQCIGREKAIFIQSREEKT